MNPTKSPTVPSHILSLSKDIWPLSTQVRALVCAEMNPIKPPTVPSHMLSQSAKNQFKVITVVDLGDPGNGSIELGRMVQVTPDRFNCFSPVWGHAGKDLINMNTELTNMASSVEAARTLFFLSDRDVVLTGNSSPWGTRAPSPSFDGQSCVHALPLPTMKDASNQHLIDEVLQAPYAGGAMEVAVEGFREMNLLLETLKKQQSQDVLPGDDGTPENITEQSTVDTFNLTITGNATVYVDDPIDFGDEKNEFFSFARASYRIDRIPSGDYIKFVCQLLDDSSLLMLTKNKNALGGMSLSLFAVSDGSNDKPLATTSDLIVLESVEISSDGIFLITIMNDKVKITKKTGAAMEALFEDGPPLTTVEKNIVLLSGLHLSVWPNLELQQMYRDAWRMLRDYFYDPDMHSVDWDDGRFDMKFCILSFLCLVITYSHVGCSL